MSILDINPILGYLPLINRFFAYSICLTYPEISALILLRICQDLDILAYLYPCLMMSSNKYPRQAFPYSNIFALVVAGYPASNLPRYPAAQAGSLTVP
jgi:hypothetical protein